MSSHAHDFDMSCGLQPGKADPAVAPTKKKTERIIVFVLGGPGSGKGTQVRHEDKPQ